MITNKAKLNKTLRILQILFSIVLIISGYIGWKTNGDYYVIRQSFNVFFVLFLIFSLFITNYKK